MDNTFLKEIRLAELDLVTSLLPPNCSMIEIGAGAGWQARELQRRGFKVAAVDITQSSDVNYNYLDQRVFDVMEYDGYTLPFPDNTFDVVFSSNVLEHIPHVESFQTELQRILKKDGIAVHVLPTSHWRFWTSLTFYFVRIKNRLRRKQASNETQSQTVTIPTLPFTIRRLFPPRHGESGTLLSEYYLFSKLRWIKLFERNGWRPLTYSTNKLFYTGENMLGSTLSVLTRRKLSLLFGSSCHIFVLQKA